MKKYTDILKEVNNYFYLYCDNCKEVYIDDLYYLRVQKFCPKCGRVCYITRNEKSMTAQEVIKTVNDYIKQQRLDKVRENNLILNK